MTTLAPPGPAAPARRRFRRRRWLAGVALLAVLLVGLYLGPSAYMADTLTRPHRQPVTTNPRAYGLRVEDVAFPSRVDHLTLRGWLLTLPGAPPARDARLIVVLHGKDGVRDDPSIGLTPLASALAHAGYEVLLFDLRGHGESEGDRFSLGWYERRDLQGALDWAQARGYSRIGVYGFSMGAATAILTAAEDRRIAAVAEDSGYADLDQILAAQIPLRSGLPGLYTPGVILMTRLMYGADAAKIRPDLAMAALRDRPVLILHGAADTYVPAANAERLWAARYGPDGDPGRVYLHIFPGAGHVKSFKTDPDAYLAVVLHFWQTALP